MPVESKDRVRVITGGRMPSSPDATALLDAGAEAALKEPVGAAYPAPEALPTSPFCLLAAGGGAPVLLKRSPEERGELHSPLPSFLG